MILDEPTENLDPTVRNTVIELVRELHQQGSTIVFCSHILSEIESLCDHVGILRNGQVVRTAKLSDLQATHHLQADYPSPQSSTLPKNFPSNIPENVKVILRSETSVLLELRGPLEPLLPWICSCGLENIRIHNVGVQGLYQEFHAPTLRVQ
jgi:ABC-2 type transport system ATP-binding protein